MQSKPEQSADIKNLIAQLKRADGVQLPKWENPNKVLVTPRTKVVPGWKS